MGDRDVRARGSLKELGSFSFQPDDCASGQTLGFFGVELTSQKDPARRIRLIKDELGEPKTPSSPRGRSRSSSRRASAQA